MTNYGSAREMIDALRVARDRARIQAHLFSLEAKKRWQGVETILVELELKLEEGGEKIAANATTSVRDVTQAAKELMQELDGTLGLTKPVRSLMKEGPSTCSPGDSLNRAAQIMWDHNCGAVPVVDADGSLVGIVTDRDLCMAAYTRGQTLTGMGVDSVMSKTVETCAPGDSIGHAARLMAEKQVRRLPVIDSGKLVGIITLADIASALRQQGGNPIPGSVALAHTLASISEQRSPGQPAQAAQ